MKQAFPCGLGARNEERESKTAQKMVHVKERGGDGNELLSNSTTASKQRDLGLVSRKSP